MIVQMLINYKKFYIKQKNTKDMIKKKLEPLTIVMAILIIILIIWFVISLIK